MMVRPDLRTKDGAGVECSGPHQTCGGLPVLLVGAIASQGGFMSLEPWWLASPLGRSGSGPCVAMECSFASQHDAVDVMAE